MVDEERPVVNVETINVAAEHIKFLRGVNDGLAELVEQQRAIVENLVSRVGTLEHDNPAPKQENEV